MHQVHPHSRIFQHNGLRRTTWLARAPGANLLAKLSVVNQGS